MALGTNEADISCLGKPSLMKAFNAKLIVFSFVGDIYPTP